MKKIALLTTFNDLNPSYSLCSVVRDQLIMFRKNGYEVVLFALSSFDDKGVPEGVEVRKVVPQIILEPYQGLGFPDKIKEDVKKVKDMCIEHMSDIDIVICHDIFFIDTYLPYNMGIREADLDAKILAWTHSAPSQRPELKDNPHANRFTLPKNTKLVYLNHDKANGLAEMYGAWLKDVRVVHNTRDIRTFWDLDPLVVKLIDKFNILEADIISVYPLSTPRMSGGGKRLESVVKIHGKLKELGYKTRLIVPNAHANADKDKRAIKNMLNYAKEEGLEDGDLIFTSLEGQIFESGVTSKVVSDLFRIANIFIFSTISENSSLVLAEAMLSGNMLVLNKNVGTLLEHAGNKALYVDFNYRTENNDNYYLDLAKIIATEFEHDKSLQTKRRVMQKQNLDYIFKHEIEPLLYEYEEKDIDNR